MGRKGVFFKVWTRHCEKKGNGVDCKGWDGGEGALERDEEEGKE